MVNKVLVPDEMCWYQQTEEQLTTPVIKYILLPRPAPHNQKRNWSELCLGA